jgi:hypothetical protein
VESGRESGGTAVAERPRRHPGKKKQRKWRTTPANDKIRQLLTDDPNMSVSDVMTILVGEHLITDERTSRSNAERSFHKIRVRLRSEAGSRARKPGKSRADPGSAPAPAAKVTAGVSLAGAGDAPRRGPGRPRKHPLPVPAASLQPASLQPASLQPAATQRAANDGDVLDHGIKLVERAARAGADRDRSNPDEVKLENLLLTKELVLAAPRLDPFSLVGRVADLTDRVGGTQNMRLYANFCQKFDSIRPTVVTPGSPGAAGPEATVTQAQPSVVTRPIDPVPPSHGAASGEQTPASVTEAALQTA